MDRAIKRKNITANVRSTGPSPMLQAVRNGTCDRNGWAVWRCLHPTGPLYPLSQQQACAWGSKGNHRTVVRASDHQDTVVPL